jgi:hypothetical protein
LWSLKQGVRSAAEAERPGSSGNDSVANALYPLIAYTIVSECSRSALCFFTSIVQYHLGPFYLPDYHSGSGSTSFWGSIFTSSEDRAHSSARDSSVNKSYASASPSLEHSFSSIHLKEASHLANALLIFLFYLNVLSD